MCDEADKGKTELPGQIVTALPVVPLRVLCLSPPSQLSPHLRSLQG